APLATRSETFTASAFQPISAGSVSSRKCLPATSISLVRTASSSGPSANRAASSTRPNAPEAPFARGAKTDWIISGSLANPAPGSAPSSAIRLLLELGRARPPRDGVENAVHDFRLLALEEGMRDVEIFVYHDPGGHLCAFQQLVCARTQDGAQ